MTFLSFLDLLQVIIGVDNKDHREIDKEVQIHYKHKSIYTSSKIKISKVYFPDQDGVKVKNKTNDQSYQYREYCMYGNDLDPGIILIEKSLGTYRNEGHVTYHYDIVEQKIIEKEVRPFEMPVFPGHISLHITHFYKQYNIEQ